MGATGEAGAAMTLTVVGSGTAVPEPSRVCAALWLEAAGQRVLIDCGPGSVHHLARFDLPWAELDHVLISHFHNDHIGDLPTLMCALKWGLEKERSAPLRLWGPVGLRDRLARLAHALGDHVTDPGFELEVRELEPGGGADLAPGLTLAYTETRHTEGSLAYRVEDGAAALGYTGDTGPSTDVADFLARVDLLVAECSLPDDQAMDTHLTPSTLADMARRARPGKLLVTHVYPQLARQDVTGLLRAAGWEGRTIRAEDGERIRI
jgi:ribonuclease BN (tRNA processing enzyme)